MITKKNHAKGGQSSKIDFFLSKRDKAKARFQRKTTPFRIHNSVFMGLLQFIENQFVIISHYEGNARSNLFSGLLHFVRNDKFKISNDGLKICNDNFNYAFSCALKNKFEIISQSDYGFCYKNYFFNLNQVFRNSYDFGERFGRNLNYGFDKNYNFGFGKNYFGSCNFGFDFWSKIYSIWHDLKGFLFNRKIKK